MSFKLLSQYKGLPRQIYFLVCARVIASIGMFIYPFLTLFLSSRMQLSEAQIGRYLLLVALVTAPAALIGGKLADLFNRKHMYIAVMLIGETIFFICGFLCEKMLIIYMLPGGYFFVNMGVPILSAMIMDLTVPGNRQESFSLIYLGTNFGVAIGPLIAGLLFERYTPWIFWGQALLNFAALLLIALFITDTRPDTEALEEISADPSRGCETAAEGSLLRQLLRAPLIIGFSLLAAVYAFSYQQLTYMLPLHMEDIFGIGPGSRFYGLVWSLNGLMVFIGTPLLVLLCKHLHPLFNMFLCGLCYALAFALYAGSNTLLPIYGLTLLWSAGEIIASTNTGVFLANHAPASHRARFQSIYELVQGLGRACGPLVMGLYLIRHSYAQAWHLVGLLCLLAGICFLVMHLQYQRKKRQAALPQRHAA